MLNHRISEIAKSGISKRKRENSQSQLGFDRGVYAGELSRGHNSRRPVNYTKRR
jgi:hypothetical protein